MFTAVCLGLEEVLQSSRVHPISLTLAVVKKEGSRLETLALTPRAHPSRSPLALTPSTRTCRPAQELSATARHCSRRSSCSSPLP